MAQGVGGARRRPGLAPTIRVQPRVRQALSRTPRPATIAVDLLIAREQFRRESPSITAPWRWPLAAALSTLLPLAGGVGRIARVAPHVREQLHEPRQVLWFR